MKTDGKTVTFRVKDYRLDGRARFTTMTLDVAEFIRRFLLHVLPKGFHRIRHYGLLATGTRAENIDRARQLLGAAVPCGDANEDADCGVRDDLPPCHAAAHACASSKGSSAARRRRIARRRPSSSSGSTPHDRSRTLPSADHRATLVGSRRRTTIARARPELRSLSPGIASVTINNGSQQLPTRIELPVDLDQTHDNSQRQSQSP